MSVGAATPVSLTVIVFAANESVGAATVTSNVWELRVVLPSFKVAVIVEVPGPLTVTGIVTVEPLTVAEPTVATEVVPELKSTERVPVFLFSSLIVAETLNVVSLTVLD